MNKLPESPFLYPILDSTFSTDLIKDARTLMRAGIKMLQLRAKKWTRKQVYDAVNELTAECVERNILLIINDSVDVAMVSDVSGVHLGQEDLPVADARKLLPNRIIGVSTHNPEQFRIANAEPVDYIAIGPMYRTSTKREAGPPLGVRFLHEIRKLSALPVVCIGGIGASHFRDLIHAGANGIAMISELYKGSDLYSTARRLQDDLSAARD